jgi:hypothetical protein
MEDAVSAGREDEWDEDRVAHEEWEVDPCEGDKQGV